jgi:hypothetical protein
MLGSITPLGERGRGRRWGWTVALYVASSSLAGTAIGAASGLAGAALVRSVPGAVRAASLAALVVIGVALDRRLLGLSLPTTRRQVNEEWLSRYRGWVVGVGFGAQLGAGIVTVVTSSTTYAALIAAFLSGRPAIGAAIGATYGALRGAALLLAAGVRRPQDLAAVDGALRRWSGASTAAAIVGQGTVAVALVAAAGVAR